MQCTVNGLTINVIDYSSAHIRHILPVRYGFVAQSSDLSAIDFLVVCYPLFLFHVAIKICTLCTNFYISSVSNLPDNQYMRQSKCNWKCTISFPILEIFHRRECMKFAFWYLVYFLALQRKERSPRFASSIKLKFSHESFIRLCHTKFHPLWRRHSSFSILECNLPLEL